MALWAAAILTVGMMGVQAAETADKGPPPFFLQDPKDSNCLAGETFKRCSIDTLFYVVGSPGKYQIHKRPLSGEVEEENEDGLCLSKKSCNEKDMDKILPAKLTKCSHCGAKEWNILGDAESGYVLTEGEGKTCLVRSGQEAQTAPCDSDQVPYTPLQLQFASASDITAMASPAARLIGAASDGDKKTLQSLLKEDPALVNVRDWDELTALIPAASGGHADIVKLLIKAGVDVNAKDKDGITALMEASIMGHKKICELLLEAGAEVDAKANSDVTALWLAAGEGRSDILKLLLKKDADAAVTRVDGITALMTASVGGHTDAVQQLLDNGADPRAVDQDGLTPLMNAAENGTVAVMRKLVEASGDQIGPTPYVDLMSKTGFTALIIAAAHGHTDVIEYLLNEAKADVHAVHSNGVTALMYAAASGHVNAMKALLDIGKVDVNEKHTNGGSALLEAATGGADEAIQVLIEYGAKVDLVDQDGVTPLMAVASQGHQKGLETILQAIKAQYQGSDEALKEHVNLASYSGGTSVMFAAAGGHTNCTQILIDDGGADVNAVAQATPEYLEKLAKMQAEGTAVDEEPHVDGVTAVHVAAQGGHLAAVEVLVAAGADATVLDQEKRSALLLAVKGNYGEVASALVKGGADPNTPYVDDDGEPHNLLMDAIIVENEEFAVLLVKNGGALYHQDEHQVTTLLQATHRGMVSVVEALLAQYDPTAHPEYLNAPSDEGITPLIAASSEGHVEIIKLLLGQSGIDVNVKDKDGTNSLMAASARGHADAVELLLKAGASVNEQNIDGHTALMFAYNGKNQVETLWERYHQFVRDSSASEEKVDDGGTGPIIQEALDNHTALVDLLLKSGADATLKDKEGHTAGDFDFNPDADAEVLDQEEKAEKKRDESKNEL